MSWEFRRLTKPLVGEYAKEAERARSAADESDYAKFIGATGGMLVSRKELIFRAFHIVKEKLSSYGGKVSRLLGIQCNNDIVIETHGLEWSIKPASLVTLEAAQPPPLEYWQ